MIRSRPLQAWRRLPSATATLHLAFGMSSKAKLFDVAQLPVEGELEIARMSTRNEPFAIGVVVAEPTLRRASSPPQRTHTLTLQRSESIGGVVHAAAAAPAATTTTRGLTAAQVEDWPLSEVAVMSSASFEVQVHWYDLESDWVTKLRLLDDEHWEAEYRRHQAADELSRGGRLSQPPSAGWIVAQYKAATFLPKPGQAEEVRDVLGVAALIMWGSRGALLTAAGQLTSQAFDAVWRDLVEPPRRAGGGVGQQQAIRSSDGQSTSTTSNDESCSAAAAHSSQKRKAATMTPRRARAAWTAPAKRPRLQSPAEAPSSAPSARTSAGRAAADTERKPSTCEYMRQLRGYAVAAPAAAPAAAAAAAVPAAAAAAAVAAAAVVPAAGCGQCEQLQSQLLEMAQDLEAVRRFVTALVDRANSGITR